jgi:hypothetical protein
MPEVSHTGGKQVDTDNGKLIVDQNNNRIIISDGNIILLSITKDGIVLTDSTGIDRMIIGVGNFAV